MIGEVRNHSGIFIVRMSSDVQGRTQKVEFFDTVMNFGRSPNFWSLRQKEVCNKKKKKSVFEFYHFVNFAGKTFVRIKVFIVSKKTNGNIMRNSGTQK